MTSDLPKWLWDILADLLDEEDVHPRLYFTSGAFEGYRQYDWCPKNILDKVPDDVRANANAIRAYRRQEAV